MQFSRLICVSVAVATLLAFIAVSQVEANHQVAMKAALGSLLLRYISAKKIYVAPIPLPIPIPIINEKNTAPAPRPKAARVVASAPRYPTINLQQSYGGGGY